jgi:hypothetical protein
LRCIVFYRSTDLLATINGVVAVPLMVIIMLIEDAAGSPPEQMRHVNEFTPTVCALL